MNKTSDLLMPVKSKTCNHNLRQSNTNAVWKKKVLYGIVLAQSIESHQIPQRSEVKRECGEVMFDPARIWEKEMRNWEIQKGIFFSLFIILWPINKKSDQNKMFDQSKLRLWEFLLSKKILLGIDILILIRGWTGLWSKTRIDVCSVI